MAIDFKGTAVEEELTFDSFGCNPLAASPATPDRVRPDVVLQREVHNNGEVVMADGRRVRFWSFADPRGDRVARDKPFPAPMIRVRQGQIVHTQLKSKFNDHTIHHHGIESTAFNDGVGHASFEVKGEYTYQWRASQAGSYFYHCHKNTVLHFEMGMYGLLIVDPPSGPGKVFANGPNYQVEALWVPDDVDPAWRNLGHDAGMCGEDVGLNSFNPKYFMISGVPTPRTLTDNRVVARVQRGQTLLIRLLCAGYSILRTTLPFDVLVVGRDARQLGGPGEPWNRPYTIPANTPFELTSAQRLDLIATFTSARTYRPRFEFLDWVGRRVRDNGRGVMETQVIVT